MKDVSFNFDEYLKPIWSGNKVFNESITFIPEPLTGEYEGAPLIYNPKKIISVKSFDLKTEYTEGCDFVFDGKRICRIKDGGMKAWDYDEFYSLDEGPYKIKWLSPEGRYVHYSGGPYHASHQYFVTYEHDGVWNGPMPGYLGERLPETVKKLKYGDELKLLFYGDSITHGAEASGYGEILIDGKVNEGSESFEPFMPIYPKLFKMRLEKEYLACKIEYMNTSYPGWSSIDAVKATDERVIQKNADLIVLAWGMNDLSLTAVEHKENILKIIKTVRSNNPKAEFILVSTTLPNIGSAWFQNELCAFEQTYYEIEKETEGVAIAPMTSMHEYLLTKKRFEDMSGNGINHPNDFLARIYAQTISALLIE